MSELILHCGGVATSRDQLAAVAVPERTKTWKPVAHIHVLERVEEALQGSGFTVASEQLALSHNDGRFFGVLKLRDALGDGVGLTAGIRNSHDKSFPFGFIAGSSVFVCDNLSFRAELSVRRKHTTFGDERFEEGVALAVGRLPQFALNERRRIEVFQNTRIDDQTAESVILRAWEEEIISVKHIRPVLQEWRKPRHEEFRERSQWSLFNAFTEVLKSVQARNPQDHALRTARLNTLLLPDDDFATILSPSAN